MPTSNPVADILKVPELKRRLLFTLGVIAAYRVGAQIPVPGVNAGALFRFFAAQQNTLLGFLNIFSGGAMGRFAIFAMGVGPYINASIIMSLLQGAHVIPYLDRLAKEGEQGRKRMNQITRYLTLGLAGLQSFGLTLTISRMTAGGNEPIVVDPSAGWIALTVLTLTTGSVFIMWLGEQITERGIGNGVSLIIFSGIVDRLPSAISGLVQQVRIEEMSLFRALLLVALVVAVTGICVWVETAQRKIPVQYAKRVVGRKMYGGSSTYLPLKVDQSGVIAVIFAVSLLAMPMTIATFSPHSAWAARVAQWERGNWVYECFYAGLIIFFCYFYNSVQFNPNDLADNLRKWGGFIPGIRPGEATARHIEMVLARITLGGALFVAAIAVLPDYLRQVMNAPFFFGGTALLIVVGVALDTIGQIQSHLIMRHYDGFFKGGGGFKGRWFNVT
ncbi:MAG TPA: preprotein translocase subunit SecY [Elusimicrobiota bacterium]|nr:preprotein translocase subunit SecY [Elusimicrobiota bacterium]